MLYGYYTTCILVSFFPAANTERASSWAVAYEFLPEKHLEFFEALVGVLDK